MVRQETPPTNLGSKSRMSRFGAGTAFSPFLGNEITHDTIEFSEVCHLAALLVIARKIGATMKVPVFFVSRSGC